MNSPSSIPALHWLLAPLRLVLLLVGTACSVGTPAFAACLEWVNLGATVPSPATEFMELVYDEARKEVVALSRLPVDGRVNLLRLQGNQWVLVESQSGVFPEGPRSGYGLCYHRGRGTVMLFGGTTGRGGAATARNDFWEWNGSSWSEIKHAGPWPPVAIGDNPMVYDPQRNRIILLVNTTNSAGLPRVWEVWEWTGSSWEKGPRMEAGPQISAVFDEFNASVFVYTQVDGFEQMWRFSPAATASAGTWRKIPVRTEFESTGGSLVYDPYRRTIIRQGGRAYSNIYAYYSTTAVWDEDAALWRLVGQMPPGNERAGSGICFDRDADAIVLYGGGGVRLVKEDDQLRAENYYFYDTWHYRREQPGFVVDLPPSQTWCPGENHVLAVTVAGEANVQWYRNGEQISGATSKILVVPNATSASSGIYSCRASNACGEIRSRDCHVEIGESLAFVGQPFTRDFCPGETIEILPPEAVGSGQITMQLQRYTGEFFEDVPGQTALGPHIFRIENAANDHSGTYRFAAGNRCQTIYSSEFHIQVGITISTQPPDMVGQVCTPLNFSLHAKGVGNRLSWELLRDGVKVNSGTYQGGPLNIVFHSLLYRDAGLYQVTLSDACQTVTTRVARITVEGANPEWMLRAPAGPAPSPRAGHAMAYDSARRVTMLFGGWIINQAGDFVTLSDLWEWDGSRWTLRMGHAETNGWRVQDQFTWVPDNSTRPVSRTDHNLVYDSKRDRLVLFGGQSYRGPGQQLILNDVWEWDGARWHFRATSGPSPRLNASMAYDSDRAVSVMYGGFLNGPNPTPDTVWEWNGTNWVGKRWAGGEQTGPTERYSQDIGGMAYHAVRKKVVWGPAVSDSRSDFYLWDGEKWQRHTHNVNELWGLQYGALVFDSHRRKSVWFGGYLGAPTNYTGLFDGTTWELQKSAEGSVKPLGRHNFGMAFDSARHVTVLFGGATTYDGRTLNGETWELVLPDTPQINEQPASQYRRAGEAAIFTVAAIGPAPLSYAWYRNGAQLENDSRISGASTPTLTISNVTEADAGEYIAAVWNTCGSALARPAILTLQPNLQIFESEDTFTLLWSDTAALLEQAGNPAGPWTEVPGAQSPFHPSAFGPARFYRFKVVSP